MQKLNFAVRCVTPKNAAGGSDALAMGGDYRPEFPCERIHVGITFLGADGNPAPFVIEKSAFTAAGVSHVEARASPAGSAGLGPVAFKRRQVSEMLAHREHAEALRRSGTPLPHRSVEATGAGSEVGAASIELFFLCLW